MLLRNKAYGFYTEISREYINYYEPKKTLILFE